MMYGSIFDPLPKKKSLNVFEKEKKKTKKVIKCGPFFQQFQNKSKLVEIIEVRLYHYSSILISVSALCITVTFPPISGRVLL
jgi:hypothetical protein